MQAEGPNLLTLDSQAPCATPSPHLFQNATGFDVNGGQFVSGDLHNHIEASPSTFGTHQSLQSPGLANQPEVSPGQRTWILAGTAGATREANTPAPFLGTTDDVQTESELYCSQLLRQGRGFPLYVPGPQPNLPEEYRRRGIAIGDVGSMTPEGIFDFFFNIYLPSDHPINANVVPDDFSPLPRYLDRDVVKQDFDTGNYVSTPSVHEPNDGFVSEQFPGGDFVFNCIGSKGAVLALPHGAHLEKLINLEEVRRYAAKHAESWYKYINGTRGRGLSNGTLYIITGWEKTRSWGMASFQGVAAENEFQLAFRPTADCGYRWRRGTPARKKHFDSPLGERTLLNQTTFLHGLTISLGTGIWARLFGDIEICQLAEPGSGKSTRDYIPYGSGGSLLSWPFRFFDGGSATGRKHYAGQNGDSVVISDLLPTSKVFHPSQIINEYLLREAPQVIVVMTHDDNWRDILQDDRAGPAVHSSSEFLLQISRKFSIKEEDGASFLVAKSEPATEDHMSTEMLLDEIVQPLETDNPPKLATSWAAENLAAPLILWSGPSTSSPSSSFYSGPSSRAGWDTLSPRPPSDTLLHAQDLPDSDLPSLADPMGSPDFKPSVGTPAGTWAAKARRKELKLATYVCHFCSADFTTKHNLDNHVNSHLGHRPYRCGKCSKTFTTRGVKKRHESRCSCGPAPTVYGNRDGTASFSTDLPVIPDASDLGTPRQDTAETGTGTTSHTG
ncbi:hypothetical protein B0H10DRAFT_765264 [Mycena sp. CBHHK59/15]|nr:hypothetical protein B0H10DRAFT_765264 [Mycena sp. CBHHK59/15]